MMETSTMKARTESLFTKEDTKQKSQAQNPQQQNKQQNCSMQIFQRIFFIVDNQNNGLNECTVHHSWRTEQHEKFKEDTNHHHFFMFFIHVNQGGLPSVLSRKCQR